MQTSGSPVARGVLLAQRDGVICYQWYCSNFLGDNAGKMQVTFMSGLSTIFFSIEWTEGRCLPPTPPRVPLSSSQGTVAIIRNFLSLCFSIQWWPSNPPCWLVVRTQNKMQYWISAGDHSIGEPLRSPYSFKRTEMYSLQRKTFSCLLCFPAPRTLFMLISTLSVPFPYFCFGIVHSSQVAQLLPELWSFSLLSQMA